MWLVSLTTFLLIRHPWELLSQSKMLWPPCGRCERRRELGGCRCLCPCRFYAADDSRYPVVVERLKAGDALFAPAHLDVEVVSALRGLARSNQAVDRVVPTALAHLARFPNRRMSLPPLLECMWDLRNNVTAYDAVYIPLAERLGGALITCDTKLANASGPACTFDLIS